ncbi:MAG: hypothetical protein IKW76_02655 [Clostridia bacterium]|nr:hypothetical protein [Clostridia bacterium]
MVCKRWRLSVQKRRSNQRAVSHAPCGHGTVRG